MSTRDLLRLIWANLNRMRGRVALTAFGVVIGAAAVLVLVSLGAGLQRSAISSLGDIGELKKIYVMPSEMSDIPVMVTEPGGAPGKQGGGQGNKPRGLTQQRLEELRGVPGVAAVIPTEELMGGVEMKLGRAVGWSQIMGISLDDMAALGMQIVQGELSLLSGQMVVGARVHENFYDPIRGSNVPISNLLDETIILVAQRWSETGEMSERTLRLRVVGVLKEGGQSDYQVFIPQREVQKLNEWFTGKRIDRTREGYNQAIVVAQSTREVAAAQEQIRALGYQAYSAMDALASINSFFTILQAVLGGIGAIALLVSAFGIINTLSMAILERTREIGLMKALGARNRDVMSIFLGEAASIGLLGGLVGAGVGWGLSRLGNLVALSYMQQSGGGNPFGPADADIVYTPLWLILITILFATLVGLISGIYPALRAATLDPLKALKYE
ncbi:MAG: ABC transporter permease [Caldilineales bacterium]|nr:ABC transporter permease [Caldilineales bacterium]